MSGGLLADISAWQPASINWKEYVAWSRMGDGISRVILRSSYGNGYTDAHFEEYWAGAIAAGVEVIGLYHYAYPEYNSPTAEADWQRKVVGNRLRANDWLMLDYEENAPQTNASWAYAWLSRQEQEMGRLPRIYADESFIKGRLQDSRLAAFPLVLANWTYNPGSRPAAPAPWKSYEILQYSDKATVPGIGTCDANVYIGSSAPTAPTGGNTVGVPSGWKDENNILTAPNGVEVVSGFREVVLDPQKYLEWDHAWAANDWPLASVRTVASVEPGNPSIGGGTRQDFRMTSLGWTTARNSYQIWVGQDFLEQQSMIGNLQGQLTQAQNQIKALQASQSVATIPASFIEVMDALTALTPQVAAQYAALKQAQPKPNVTAPLPVAAASN